MPLADVDLGDRGGAEALGDIGEHRDLDTPALHERDLLHRRRAGRELAAERLVQSGELGQEQAEQRAGDELGRASAATVIGGTVVAGLDERHVVVGEQRHQQPAPPSSAPTLVTSPSHQTMKSPVLRGERGPQALPLPRPSP